MSSSVTTGGTGVEATPVTPEVVRAHGLTDAEYAEIRRLLGRAPNLTELGVFSVMWSEHCSYKSSRKHLKQLPTEGARVIHGPGENAGVMDIGDGLAVVFKIESHNHPSFIEPYQGAATGVGGILRDIFTMGARPIASLNSLRFGSVRHPKTPYLVSGVVGGIGGYGNCIGVPTVGGEITFDECYDANILVNAFTLGLVERDRIFTGKAQGSGNPVMYVGSKTGRDGVHGATMASESFSEDSEQRRPTVQVGDPFTEKLLLEACLDLMQTDAIVGIQDMGAAGLTSSAVEMAGRGGSGVELELASVPLREQGMTPYEILLSESQERMLLVAHPEAVAQVQAIFQRWDLDAVVVGKVIDEPVFQVLSEGRTVASIPVAALTDAAPAYDRPAARPARQDDLQRLDVDGAAATRKHEPGAGTTPGVPQYRVEGMGLPAIRPLRAQQHGGGARRRRRRGPHQGHVQGSGADRGLQRPVLPPGSPHRRHGGGGRSGPEPLLCRRHAAGAHGLPELRQPRAGRRDVAVLPGDPGHARGVLGAGDTGGER